MSNTVYVLIDDHSNEEVLVSKDEETIYKYGCQIIFMDCFHYVYYEDNDYSQESFNSIIEKFHSGEFDEHHGGREFFTFLLKKEFKQAFHSYYDLTSLSILEKESIITDPVMIDFLDNRKTASLETTQPSLPKITNDHTCPGCGNTKCSKTETKCWRCGAAI